ncbi:MAG: hypothetical protein NC411_03595 [Bacteroides sp.]|nr:hypothetical protein [Bacteroides sp.]
MPTFDGRSSTPTLNSYHRHCVIDIFREGTSTRVLRKEFTSGETIETDIGLDAGRYDIMVWCDCSPDGVTARSPYFDLDDLHTVSLLTENYIANTDEKDASCVSLDGVEIDCGHTRLELALERPFAKYRLIADDVAAYKRLREANPGDYPPLDELVFNVYYEFFLPVSYNVVTRRPNDSSTGISYRCKASTAADGLVAGESVLVGGDFIFATDEHSVITLTLEVRDTAGKLYSRATGISVEYCRGYETTIRGNFLTLGASAGGISIDTYWRDDIFIYF